MQQHLYIQKKDDTEYGADGIWRVNVDTLETTLMTPSSPFWLNPEYDLSFLACLTSFKGDNGNSFLISVGNYNQRVNVKYLDVVAAIT